MNNYTVIFVTNVMKNILSMKLKASMLFFLFTALGITAYPQGCNDAGLCSMGDLDGKGLSKDHQFNTQLSYSFSLGEKQSLINTLQFEQRFRLLEERGQVFVQMPFHYVYGNLGQTYGPGDISLGFNYTFLQKDELAGSFLIAARIPTSDATRMIDGKGAPMVYQTSLGTYDIALGANMFYGKWQFSLGYLKPLGSNNNYFNPDEWPGDEDASDYQKMNDLARGDDAMLRATRFFHTEKNQFNVGLLALYRLQKDKVTIDGVRTALDDSDGFTLNINLGYQKILANKDALTLTLAAPLITREVRVDGLTRTFVVMLTYAFSSKKKENPFEQIKF